MLLPSLLWQILLPKFMADVIAIIVRLILLPLVMFNVLTLHWQVLLPSLLWQILLPKSYGRCYCHIIVVDVISTLCCY